MIWARRSLIYANYAPYQDIMEKLLMANPAQYQEFLMVSVAARTPGEIDYYIGLPNKTLLAMFDGFQEVTDAQLPNEIDSLLLGDQTKEPFTSRFKFKAKH